MDELQASFDRWEASFDALYRYLLDTDASVTEPVMANSDRSELVIAPAGMPDPLAPVPAIGEPPAIARAAPIDTIDVVPAPVTMSTTTTPLLWASRSSPSPASPVTPATASSVTTGLVTASAGLVDPPALVPAIGEPRTVVPAATNTTSTMAPASCLTDCAAHAITMQTTTALLLWASGSSPSSASPSTPLTSDFSAKLATDIDNGEPGALLDIYPVLAAAAAGNGTLHGKVTKGAASTAITSSSGSPRRGDSTLACAFILSATPAMSATSDVISSIVGPANDDCEHGPSLTVTPVLSSEFGVPVRLSTSSTTEVDIVLPVAPVCIPCAFAGPWLELVPPRPPDPRNLLPGAWSSSSITVQSAVNTTLLCNDAGKVLAYMMSDEGLHNDKVQQQPWPPPPVFCEKSLRDELQEIFCNSASSGLQHSSSNGHGETILAVLESQMQKLLALVNGSVLVLFLSGSPQSSRGDFDAFSDGPVKPCSQWPPTLVQQNYQDLDIVLEIVCKLSAKMFKQTWYAGPSSVIYLLVAVSASVLHLWRVPLFSILFLDLTSEELYGLVFFQWEIAWQLRTVESERQCYYQVLMGMDMLDMHRLRWFDTSVFSGDNTLVAAPVMTEFQQLNLLYYYQASKFCPVAVLELQGSTYKLFSGGKCQAYKVQSYRKLSDPDHCQEGIYFKVRHISYPVVQYTIHVVSHCGGVAFYSIFPPCTGMRMEKSKGNTEPTQWLVNDLMSECFSSNIYASALSSIKRPSRSSKLGHQVVATIFFWVPTDLDGKADQYWNIQWDPGNCMFAVCNSEKRWTTLNFYEQVQWPSLQFVGAFRIWLVPWNGDGLVFSTGNEQAPFQGGRDVIPAAFSDQVHVTHDYYITFINQIGIDYDYYLNQAYYMDTVCSDIISYHEDYHDNSSKTKEVGMPWDPGKSSFTHSTSKLRLGDKPSFKEGGMLGPLPVQSHWAVLWALERGGLGPAHSKLQIVTYKYPTRGDEEGIQKDQNGTAAAPSLPPRL